MTLSKVAISRPVTTTMFFIGIVLLGIVSFHKLPIQLLPDVQFPEAMVYWRYPGLSLDDTIDQLTEPIEAIVAEMPRVHELYSHTHAGFVRVHITFEYGTDMRFALLELQEKMIQFRKTLPQRGHWNYVRSIGTERMQSFFMWLIIQGKEDREMLRRIAEDQLLPQLEAVDGVAQVDVAGYYRESVDVVFDRDRLVAHDLGLGRAIQRIQSAAERELGLGRLRSSQENFSVKLGETIENEAQLRELPLDDRGVVRLSDVAHVYRHQRKSDWISRINGENFVGIIVRKEPDANPLRLAVKARRVIAQVEENLPPGYSIIIDEDAAKIIEQIIHQVGWLAVVGALLAMGILVLFVRNLRMATIVFAAIPISVIATFNLMYFGGVSINVVTLVGLALGIGMLVDNAIVVLENIFRHFERGGHAVEASDRATQEVWRALLATTLTNVVVFTPILFVEGRLALIFREGALAIIFPVTVSLLVALTLVPMVTSRILAGRERRERRRTKPRRWSRVVAPLRRWVRRRHPYWPAFQNRPRRLYREVYFVLLRAALRHRVRLVLLTLLVLYLTLKICAPMVERGRMDDRAQGRSFTVYIQVPRGSTREQLVKVLDVVEGRLQKLPELDKTRAWGEPEEGAEVNVKLVPQNERDRDIDEVREGILDFIGEVAGATLSLRPPWSEGEGASDMRVAYSEGGEVEIHGAHWEALEWVAVALARQLELIPGIARVEVESMRGNPEIQFTIDRRRAAQFNIQAQDLATYLRTSERHGEFSQITMERGDDKLDVILRMGSVHGDPEADADEAKTLSEIKSMEVISPFGGAIPLAEIGHFQPVAGERHISRTNKQYSLDVDYFLEPGADRGDVGKAVRSLLEEITLPAGYTAEVSGHGREMREEDEQIKWMLWVTVLLIYMVMASVFESLLAPLVIMLTLPLAAVGVFWGLALTGSSFDELARLGLIVLTGIVVNNGIVMMDFMQMLRRERGFSRTAAVITACRHRLRPILMTALTTILGLLPLAVRTSEEIEWEGLAVVVISGLAVSTVLTLVILPAMLMNFEDVLGFLKRVALVVWRRRWVLYFFSPRRMRAKRLELVPAGLPVPLAPTFSVALRSAAPETEAPRWAETDRKASEEETAPRATGIELRKVHMTYRVFHPRNLLNVIPSTRYKYGMRPPRGIEALRGINLQIGRGVFGLVGPNGAGKTTLLKIITGLIRPTFGYVGVNGLDMATEGPRARAEIGYLPQSHGIYGTLTAREYLAYHSLILGVEDPRERRRNVEAVLDQVGLLDVADELVGTFSGGMRQRMGIARLLLTVPSVIVVDEPTAGLDPIERVKFRILLSQLATDRTVLLSTHIIDDISSSCRQLAVLNEGRIVFDGTPDGLIDAARDRIWEYVGRFEDEAMIAQRFRFLYKKAAGPDRVLYRFIADPADAADLPGVERVAPSLEDAYVLAIATAPNPDGRD